MRRHVHGAALLLAHHGGVGADAQQPPHHQRPVVRRRHVKRRVPVLRVSASPPSPPARSAAAGEPHSAGTRTPDQSVTDVGPTSPWWAEPLRAETEEVEGSDARWGVTVGVDGEGLRASEGKRFWCRGGSGVEEMEVQEAGGFEQRQT